MSAIITDTFRRSNAKTFVDDIVSGPTNKYFIGIGRSDPWDAYEDTSYLIPSSTGGYSDSLEVLNNLQALQKLLYQMWRLQLARNTRHTTRMIRHAFCLTLSMIYYLAMV